MALSGTHRAHLPGSSPALHAWEALAHRLTLPVVAAQGHLLGENLVLLQLLRPQTPASDHVARASGKMLHSPAPWTPRA